jgi:hypothetical protein
MGRTTKFLAPLALTLAGAAGLAGACGGDDTATNAGTQNPTTAGGAAGMGGQSDGGGGSGAAGGSEGGGGSGPVFVLSRPSKSGTIDINGDDSLVAMVNRGDDSVSIFTAGNNERLAKVDVGDEPSSVVFHPNGTTLYVANRAEQSLTVITGAETTTPTAAPFNNDPVGSEPTGIALSPTGKYLAVAEWAEGVVSLWDTATGDLVDAVAVKSPRALAFTNDGDTDDDDELLVVPEFFGAPNDGATDTSGPETSDQGRVGAVHAFALPALTETSAIALAPRPSRMLAATGVSPDQVILDSGSSGGVMASPNQLWALAIAGNKIYLPSISVSADGPPNVGANIQPVVYVADLTRGAEDVSEVGSTNLARLVRDKVFTVNPDKLYLADLVDIGFAEEGVAYVLSRGDDVLQRVVYEPGNGVEIGMDGFPEQIVLSLPFELTTCRVPSGVVIAHDGANAYVNCVYDRDLGVVDLGDQALTATVESWPDPAGAAEISANDGFRFFHTARDRWSRMGYSDCASCHPDGLSDNVTWQFGTGPRQTPSLDGSFSKSDDKQRIFNWTGIFDEIHDFERNTRDTSGGVGAIVSVTSTLFCDTPSETQLSLSSGLGKPSKEVADNQLTICSFAWDDITAWVKTIRPPKALRAFEAADVDAGAQLFAQGKCNYCHGGSGWTVSRLYWVPDGDDGVNNSNAILSFNVPFARPASWPVTWNYDHLGVQIQNQRSPIADDGTGPPEATDIAPQRVSCVIRNVGTFGVQGNTTLTNALELKADGARAQGRGGFNVPSLYGLALSAPYLHHGQARTLVDLFADAAWVDHLKAAEPSFSPDAAEIEQLVAYLLSIDADSDEVPLPPTATFVADGCPATYGTPD